MLALGREIVRQFELTDRGTVLARWMAHHVAEIIAEAEAAEGQVRRSLEKQAVDLILRIWRHRRSLPDPADPLAGYREAIEVLGRLLPDSNPWLFVQRDDRVGLLKEMFETLSRAVYLGLVLTCVSGPRPIAAAEEEALEDEERQIVAMMESWRPLVVPRREEIRLSLGQPTEDSEDVEPESETPELRVAESGQDGGVKKPPEDETSLQSAIMDDLRLMQSQLASLLERWRSSGGEGLQSQRREVRIPQLVAQIYEVVRELEELFPGRRFTPDGHLVGSIGEVLAEHHYGLELCSPSFPGHDGRTADGKLVQVKATQRGRIGLRSEPEMLLVLHLSPDGTVHQVFNGPGSIAWEAAGPLQKNGQRAISVAKLRQLLETVPEEQRIPSADAARTVPESTP